MTFFMNFNRAARDLQQTLLLLDFIFTSPKCKLHMSLKQFVPLLGIIFILFSCDKKEVVESQTDLSPEDYLYFASHDTVYRIKPNGGPREMLYNGTDDGEGRFKGKKIVDISIDPASGKLAFLVGVGVFPDPDKIFVGSRDGQGNLTDISITNREVLGDFFYGMDFLDNKVYIQCDDSYVARVNSDGSGAIKLIDNLNSTWLHHDIAIDPTTTNLYSCGLNSIWKLDLSEKNAPFKLVSTQTDLYTPIRISLNIKEQHVFFSGFTGGIYKVKLDGTGYTTVFTPSTSIKLDGGLAIDNQNSDIYFTNQFDNRIYKLSANSTTPVALSGIQYFVSDAIAYN